MIGQQRISLDAEAFEKLIQGEILEYNGTKILLQDIGYPLMRSIIQKAQDELIDKLLKRDDDDG